MNVKNAEISYELCQNLSRLQIYPGFAENSELKPLAERYKKSCSKVDLSIVTDPNIPFGLVNYGENVFFFNSVIQFLYSLPVFRDYINKLRPLVKGVAVKIRKQLLANI